MSRLVSAAVSTNCSRLGVWSPEDNSVPGHRLHGASLSADRPREQLDDEIELMSALLNCAKALKTTAAAPMQQAAPTRRNIERLIRYGSIHGQYNALYNFLILILFQRLARMWWPQPPATCIQTHCSPPLLLPWWCPNCRSPLTAASLGSCPNVCSLGVDHRFGRGPSACAHCVL